MAESVRAGSMLAPVVCLKFFGPRRPWLAGRVKPKGASGPAKPGLDLS